MATYGKVKPFNPKTDDWDVYEERLRFYMAANNITDATLQRSILLTVCGEQTFRLLRSLVPEGKLDADGITYDSLVGLLQSHYKKKQSVVVHRFNFNTRSRKPTETIADYIAALRELSLNCSFGSKERLEEMLRDRLICGVNHHGIQRKLPLRRRSLLQRCSGARAVHRVRRGRRQEAGRYRTTSTQNGSPHADEQAFPSLSTYMLPLWRSPLSSSVPAQRYRVQVLQEERALGPSVPGQGSPQGFTCYSYCSEEAFEDNSSRPTGAGVRGNRASGQRQWKRVWPQCHSR